MFDPHGSYNEFVKATLEAINQMQADGLISCYALSGATAAIYYSEPATVLEIEVLVILPFDPNGESASLTALQEYLVGQGCNASNASDRCFVIGGWPVRFVVARNNLEREAVAASLPVPINGLRAFVVMAEHLIAIALSETRSSDRVWMLRLTERDAIDELVLKSIVTSHGLLERWAEFERDFSPRFPSKDEMRSRLASLSFSEKVKILEKLRDRGQAIAASGLRPKATSGTGERGAKEKQD